MNFDAHKGSGPLSAVTSMGFRRPAWCRAEWEPTDSSTRTGVDREARSQNRRGETAAGQRPRGHLPGLGAQVGMAVAGAPASTPSGVFLAWGALRPRLLSLKCVSISRPVCPESAQELVAAARLKRGHWGANSGTGRKPLIPLTFPFGFCSKRCHPVSCRRTTVGLGGTAGGGQQY